MYIECRSGAAGDMLLGALIDAGLPVAELENALGSLQLGHTLVAARVLRGGLTATKIDVQPRDGTTVPPPRSVPGSAADRPIGADDELHSHGGHSHRHPQGPSTEPDDENGGLRASRPEWVEGHRTLAEIERLIRTSSLSASGQRQAIALFDRLGEVEAAIHGLAVDEVHLHEVGALDSIIDIVGLVFAFEWFGISDVVVSPVNVGGGTVRIAHGRVPVPAPATLALLKGIPIYNGGPDVELVTPTGALVLSHYGTSFGPMPAMTPQRVGYGAGTRDFAETPNVVRVVIGQRSGPAGISEDTVVKIECEVDDMNPQFFAPATDRLFDAGALDVFVTAIHMKKGRPGHLVTVLAPPARRADVCQVLFQETTTLGLRFETMHREVLERRWESVSIAGVDVRIKVAGRDGQILNVAAEFDDCVRAAKQAGRPVKEVQAEALRAWWARAR
jgi:uncharacterized protein (TIGR00299 family) protein